MPFNCDVIVGEPLPRAENADAFVAELGTVFGRLLAACPTRAVLEDD